MEISSQLAVLLRKILADCEQFETDISLYNFFSDPKIIIWQSDLPQSFTKAERVENVINYLSKKWNADGSNALYLMISVLTASCQPEDGQYQELNKLLSHLSEKNEKIEKPKKFDFFISYNRNDKKWAEWIAWQLEHAGYTTIIQAWDFRPGGNFVFDMQKATAQSERTIAVLSPDYIAAKFTQPEWSAAFAQDPTGEKGLLLPIRVQECETEGLLPQIVYIDLVGLTPDDALESLLNGVKRGRAKPLVSPRFPGLSKQSEPDFPARIHTQDSLEKYHQDRVSELIQPRFQIDNRFIQLILLLDQGEETQNARWVPDIRKHNDLREILQITSSDYPALVLLGAPGSGKSTLLRRLQLEESRSYLEHENKKVVLFVSLHRYGANSTRELQKPYDWLESYWNENYPNISSWKELFRNGHLLLLLDALNEMPSRTYDEYLERIELWRDFLHEIVRYGNRIVFSCRTLDYSAILSGPDLRVPQVEIEPMKASQIYQFLQVHSPTKANIAWEYLKSSPQLSLYSRPYFLKLLVEQIDQTQDVPKGSAELFTAFVRSVLKREIEKGNPLFTPGALLDKRDHNKLTLKKWSSPYDLPRQGVLIPSHDNLAFNLQSENLKGEGGQFHIEYNNATTLLNHPRASDILQAGLAMGLLEEDIAHGEIAFFHQLLQEYFAARYLTQKPNIDLVRVEWHQSKVNPKLEETIRKLSSSDPLPLLPSTGWEETTLLAAAMSKNADNFIRDLMDVNLPLAAQCAALPELNIQDALQLEICQSLVSRMINREADLRARIIAGYALGSLGDPRFKRNKGQFGDYLLPPMITVSGGQYSIGSEEGEGYYEDEAPIHNLEIQRFQIGKFPVTNAEYALFIDSGGYENEEWWVSPASKLWLRGEESKIQIKNRLRKNRLILQSNIVVTDWLLERGHITQREVDYLRTLIAMTDDEFETFLNMKYASGKRQIQPRFWESNSFNNPLQPVVGICWYEAQAYCAWLTAQATHSHSTMHLAAGTGIYRLPTEVEWEAAASGKQKRRFAFGETFVTTFANTLEGHIRRTTPIGIYPGGETPDGIADLSGNVYEWTSTAYYPYPYENTDGRENIDTDGSVKRVLRGGAFFDEAFRARCACRLEYLPHSSPNYVGFRLAFQNL